MDKALKVALHGADVSPSSHSNRLALGQVYFYRKNLKRALEALEKGIELNPDDADGYVFLATTLSHSGASLDAVDRLDQAFSLNPNLRQWHRSFYIVAYFNAKRYADAIAVWDKLDDSPVYFCRWIAAAFAHVGRENEAQATAQLYLKTYPDFNLGDHLSRMPFQHPEDLEHYAAGLRLAGLDRETPPVAG